MIAIVIGNTSSQPTPSHRFANRMLSTILLVLVLAGVFRSQLRQIYRDQILPATISIAVSITSEETFQPLRVVSRNLEVLSGRKVILTFSEDSHEDMHQLATGQVNLAVIQGILEHHKDVSVVAPLYYDAVHIIARKSLSVLDLDELKGKRVAVGRHGSATHQLVEMLRLESHELFESMLCVELDWSELPQRSELDAAIAIVRLGDPTIEEFLRNSEFQLLNVSNSEKYIQANPLLIPSKISTSDYSSLVRSVETLCIPVLLAANSRTSTQLVRRCLSAIYDSKERVDGIIPLETASRWEGLPLHPAARQYFDSAIAKPSALSPENAIRPVRLD